MIHTYACSSWLEGIICIGVLSLAMSTADSLLHTSSILFVHDLAPFLKISMVNQLLLSKLFVIITGGLGLLIALCEEDLLRLLLLTRNFYVPIVTVPFCMAILGFRPKTLPVLLGIRAGFSTVVC